MVKDFTDTYLLNDGYRIPCIGYGTYLTSDEDVCRAVMEALKQGYRLIDTASMYKNEAGVGRAVRESGIPREEIFVTSKCWNTDRGYEQARKAFEQTMENMRLDYLDLYLIHWPANRKQFGEQAASINAETWRAFEDLKKEGRVRCIGLSNFLPHHIDELMQTASIPPAVIQLEFHPGGYRKEELEYNNAHGYVTQAWAPLGRAAALQGSIICEIAEKYGKTPAQVCLRWEIQHGVLPIPKSVHPGRIAENRDVFGFELTDEEMRRIDGMEEVVFGSGRKHPDEVDF